MNIPDIELLKFGLEFIAGLIAIISFIFFCYYHHRDTQLLIMNNLYQIVGTLSKSFVENPNSPIVLEFRSGNSIYAKACREFENEPLTGKIRSCRGFFEAKEFLYLMEMMFVQYKNGYLDERTWRGWITDFWYTLQDCECIQRTWELTRTLGVWRKDFQEFMDDDDNFQDKEIRIGFYSSIK
jgi:hypothetical protein